MDSLLETLLDELRPQLPVWYPDVAPDAELVVANDDARAIARVVRITVPGASGAPVELIAKIDAPREPTPAPDDRPRLVPMTDPELRRGLEFEALKLVEARLREVGDDRLEAVRALGVLPKSNALVMEVFESEPFHRVLARKALGGNDPGRSTTVAALAGRWLRILHESPTTTTLTRQRDRAEIVGAFEAYLEYLAAETGRDLSAVVRAGVEAAGRLPDPLPTVLSHGDFAPRNILVGRSGRVAVVDLLARWKSPPYEDLATFLVALQTNRANAATRGLLFGRAAKRLEPAFLKGYFGAEPVPRDAIRIYELLLVLDKWAARSHRSRTHGLLARVRDRLIDGHFEAHSRRLARRLGGRV
jgi:aminoglycoside phosphotransferase (APT) family kinase protein